MMRLPIPQLSLVVLIGPSGAGKSTFARAHFLSTEIVSSDTCRAMISDDENDQSVTPEAFDLLHTIVAKRLAKGRLTVIDATNVQADARKPLVQLARSFHCLPVAIALNVPERVCQERNLSRPDRAFGRRVIRHQVSQLRRSLGKLKQEGFRHIFVLNGQEEIDSATIERVPLWNDKRDEHGPFDLIGDVHGCCDELEELLGLLGYQSQTREADPVWGDRVFSHPAGRKAVFVGDLVDRGPRSVDALVLVRNMVHHGTGLCVPGNHDMKLLRKLNGRNVQVKHGLAETLAQIEALPAQRRQPFCAELRQFLDQMVSHYVLDQGRLVVAHAGLTEELQGRGSGKVREFALYGATTGKLDEHGLPERLNWAADYRGSARVVYGHTPVAEPEWLNRTVNIDTGCVFGGKLTALRYPENEFLSVPAKREYCPPKRPFLANAQSDFSAQQQADDLLDADDVRGKQIIATRLQRNVIVRAENAAAAWEVVSRFAANPKWLIYLPPTMSPAETSSEAGLLEHPAEAFAYYRKQGVREVLCQEKHMGSRAVVVLCRDAAAARERFGVRERQEGVVVTRTGRRFFNSDELEREFLRRLQAACNACDLWSRLETTWVCLDCELMPWSVKAQELLKSQYAAAGAAGQAALPAGLLAVEQAAARAAACGNPAADDLQMLGAALRQRAAGVERFIAAYRRYCWPVNSLADLKLAPFHLLATEGAVHCDKDHPWHLSQLANLCQADPQLLLETRALPVDVTDTESQAAGIRWWTELTAQGGEGMVVKPREWIARGAKGLVQPALKCRGPEYLRIIYGPDYDRGENLARLRVRKLGHKRALALREFALGIEALERFVARQPLRKVHQCVFGVLAMESEPVDPRL